ECLGRLGIEVTRDDDNLLMNGAGGAYAPVSDELNVAESGVGMNFLTSAACLSENPVTITGSKRITERPISEVVTGLRQLGCSIEYLGAEGFPPIRVQGGGIRGGHARIRGGKTSQYFSSIVISAPCADGAVTLTCLDTMSEKPYLDITLQMMADFGVEAKNDDYKRIEIPAGQTYAARDMTIEGDYSNAAFFFLAAAVCKSRVTVSGLNADTRQGDRKFLELMERMGCNVLTQGREITVEGKPLHAIEEDMSDLPDLVPPAAIASAFAVGTSRFTNIGHLRHKECDRLAVMASELRKMGGVAQCDKDSLIVEGGGKLHGARIDPHNDHRIAMSFAVAGLPVGNQLIEDEMCVAKSFPDFWERFRVFSE
ncbi:MAG: 3-phosphoshikimate 1-carboxyvinyltransferase, partial [Gammaproteobacteria bacterium]|nr:3-phosphoshikimate 1-carboxyvinyltransferase [Gammaproteobacteria bacterium]